MIVLHTAFSSGFDGHPLAPQITWKLMISRNRPDTLNEYYVCRCPGCWHCHVIDSQTIVSITMTSYWARWRFKSPASPLFAQPFIRAQIKENIKVPRHWPLCGEFTGDRHKKASNAENVSFDDVIMRRVGSYLPSARLPVLLCEDCYTIIVSCDI